MLKPLLRVLLALLVLSGGYLTGLYFQLGLPWSQSATVFLVVTVAGAFGGLLYTARESGFEFPHRDPKNPYAWKLGWVSDCGYGIAGGYVVFLVLPTDLGDAGQFLAEGKAFGFLKIVALSLVGGYGGRQLMDQAFANIARDAKEAKEAALQLQQSQLTDAQAKILVNQQLDPKIDVQDIAALKSAVASASLPTRFDIFKDARSFRSANWETNPELLDRCIPVFEALNENLPGEKYHRNHAQLGYALKDLPSPQWQQAYDELTTAIALRDKVEVKGFLMYELNRAICAVHLKRDPKTIKSDLNTAAARPAIKEIIADEKILVDWMIDNKFKL